MQKILIVDDTKQDLKTGVHLLTRAGYQVSTATDGTDALGKVQNIKPDIILLDLIMPGMDGMATLRALKEIIPDTPVVLCTVAGQEPVVRLAMLSGASGVVIKPYEPDTMLRTIRRALGEE